MSCSPFGRVGDVRRPKESWQLLNLRAPDSTPAALQQGSRGAVRPGRRLVSLPAPFPDAVHPHLHAVVLDLVPPPLRLLSAQSAAAGSELRSSRSTRCGAAGVPEVAERFVHHQRRPEHGRAPLPAPPPIHIHSPLPLPATAATLTDQQSVQAAHCGADPRCALPCVWPQASPNAPRWPVAAFDRRIAATPRTRGRRRLQRSPQLRRLTCIARIASQLAGERGSGGCSRDGGPVPPLQHGRKLDGNLCACAAARRAARRAASFRAAISEAQKAQGGLHAAQAWAERQGGAAASALVAQGLGARG